MGTNRKTAKIAGVLFLSMVVFGLLSEVLFRQKIFSSNDISVTANAILSNQLLYRMGIVGDILMSCSYLLTALVLYQVFASVNKGLAGVMVVFTTAGSVILLMNVLVELAPLYILTGNGFMSEFASGQQHALAYLFYSLYQHGYMIGQIFFSLWVLPLGLLIIQSGFMPKVLGILFMIETIFGLFSVLLHFLAPSAMLENILMIPMMIAEFAFMFYLLIRGLNESKVRN